jgi:hypothetical protein
VLSFLSTHANLILTAFIAMYYHQAVFIADLIFGIFVYLTREKQTKEGKDDKKVVRIMKFIDDDSDFVRI